MSDLGKRTFDVKIRDTPGQVGARHVVAGNSLTFEDGMVVVRYGCVVGLFPVDVIESVIARENSNE